MDATIKPEYKNNRVAFGKSAAPLYKRDDINELAIMALESNNPSLIKLFDHLPLLAELKKKKTEAALGRSVADKKN